MTDADLSAVSQDLLRRASNVARLEDGEVLQFLDSPKWEAAGQMYDWRNHVNSDIRRCWLLLSPETRIALFLSAAISAYDEEGWDPV